jgi:hypothetical protein
MLAGEVNKLVQRAATVKEWTAAGKWAAGGPCLAIEIVAADAKKQPTLQTKN